MNNLQLLRLRASFLGDKDLTLDIPSSDLEV